MGVGDSTTATQGGDGGVFKSFNRGESFSQIALIPSVSDVKPTIAATSIVSFAIDPQDRLAIYIGTRGQGMFYTYNGGNSWTKSTLAPQSRVNAIAVDPKNKCTIYASVGSQVFKSVDCSRSWRGTFIQDRPDQTITALAIDPQTPSIIYASDVKGDVFKSTDFASSWTNIARFQDTIRDLIIDSNNSSVIYAATANRGIRRTRDAGDSWQDLSNTMKQYPGATIFRKLVLNPSRDNSLIHASSYGLLATFDGGNSWETISLLTAPGAAFIYSLAVNPTTDNEIYYATERTLFSTFDGGQNWITKAAWNLAVTYALI